MDVVSYTEDIRRTWKTRRVLGEPVPNRFRPECSREYKEWLKKSLAGTIEPGPNVPHIIADVGAKHQIRLHRLQEKYDKNELDHQRRHSEDAKVIAQLKQELRRARKGEIAVKMEKGKNVEVKTTEESLRMKLRRLKQEIREMGERGIEVELATVAVQAKSAALDAELMAKMARYAVINEETVAMRKEHDAFNNDITTRLQKLYGKYPFFHQEATNSGPEGTGPESVEEELEEEIVYRPPFKGRLKEENGETAPETYEFTPRG
uniref:Uncharacterized protein n=1 Tax=Solanum tuberosum TaxID=4113 RepID=M1CMG0_SOLTU